jgi:uncharacterized membrane protein
MYSPKGGNNTSFILKRPALRSVILILIIFWIAAFSNLIFTGYAGILYPFANKCFSLVCHQDPEKSFTYAGKQMLVCARCTGIYLGAAMAAVISLFPFNIRMPYKKYLFVSALPLFADVILYNSGVYSYNKSTALITGIILGSAVFIYILAAVENYKYEYE